MAAQLNLFKEYTSNPLNIPFREEGKSVYRLKIKTKKYRSPKAVHDDADRLIQIALNKYITHYFPEFYLRLYDEDLYIQNGGNEEVFVTLRDQLTEEITIENPGRSAAPLPDRSIIIFKLELPLFQIRRELVCNTYLDPEDYASLDENTEQLPPFEPNLIYFNEKNEIGPTLYQCEFDILSLTQTANSLSDVLKTFSKQQKNGQGPALLKQFDFHFLSNSVKKLIINAFKEIMEEVTAGDPHYKFLKGDTVTFYFAQKGPDKAAPGIALSQITFRSVNFSIANEYMVVGYFSLVRYNKYFKDQLTLHTLKDYDRVLQKKRDSAAEGNPFSVWEFLTVTAPQMLDELGYDPGGLYKSDTTEPGDNGENNDLLNAAIEVGVIEVGSTSDLETSANAYTAEEILVLRNEIVTNSELYEKADEKQQRRSLTVGIDITAKMGNLGDAAPFAESGQNELLDAAGLGGSLDQILRNFGLKQLAREALLCLGFGIDFEMARLRLAMEASMECQLLAGGNTRPYFDPADMFPMFLITGDLRQEILKIILSELQKTILAIVLKLAEMLREACRRKNPYASNYGDPRNNLNDFINLSGPKIGSSPFDLDGGPSLPGSGLPQGGGPDAPGQVPPGPHGLSPSETMDYLDGLSDILSGVDVCTLLINRESVSDDLLDRIIEFNESYENENVSANFTTPSRVLEMFGFLGSIADRDKVIALCNEIANAFVVLNQNNICLTEDDLRSLDIDEQNNLEELLDLIENGLDPYGNGSGTPGAPGGGGLGLPPPVFNFDCPDLPNYINDPTITRMLPETFSNLVEFVELQFLYSTDSIKNILLEPKISSEPSPTFPFPPDMPPGDAANDWPELPKPNPAGMDFVLNMILGPLKNSSQLVGLLTQCIADNPDLVGLEAAEVGANVAAGANIAGAIANAITGTGAAGFQAAIDGLDEKVSEIAASATDNPTSPITTKYVFNRNFYDAFINYVNIDDRSWNSSKKKYTIKNHILGEYIGPGHRLYNNNAREKMTFSFPKSGHPKSQNIQLNYVAYEDVGKKAAYTNPMSVNLSKILDTTNQGEFKSEVVEDFNDLSLVKFVDSAIATSTNTESIAPWYAQQILFPYTYALITDYVFDYFIKNGIFDAAALQAVAFFHDNKNCAVGDVADLLDVQGIFDQMQEEYLEAACQDKDTPARNRLRDVIKMGMFLLLIQVHVAEFIIKNIFVFSAVKLDGLFGKEFIVTYMRDQIRESIRRFFDTVDARAAAAATAETLAAKEAAGDCPATRGKYKEIPQYTEAEQIRNSIIDIFNRKVKRLSAGGIPGIRDMDGDIVFPEGTVFEYNDQDFYNIIDFLTEERIRRSMGTAAAPGPVSNAVTAATPMTDEKTMEEIFLSSLPAYTVPRPPTDLSTRAARRTRSIIGATGWKAQLKARIAGTPRAFGADRQRPAQPPEFASSRIFWTRTYSLPTARSLSAYSEFKLWMNLPRGNGANNLILLLEIKEKLPLAPDQGRTLPDMTFEQLPLNNTEMKHILAQPEYQEYFSTVFAQELITLLPIIQNFYLTNQYFGGIEKAMQTTKDRVIGILSQTIQNQDHFDTQPRINRNAARTTALNMDTPNTDTMARDYILKMLIMTPINILKGIIEMIDPHVVVTKLIKTGTGAAFNELSRLFNQLQIPGTNASGEDLLKLILCLIAAAMRDFPTPPGFPPPPDNFFPRISEDGIDFTGTISGMLMIPPTPFGLIYLLLSLINIELPGPDANLGLDFGYGGNVNAEVGPGATSCPDDDILSGEGE